MGRGVLPSFEIFWDATFFWQCSWLSGREGYTYQAIAMEGFAIELHLKCLHRISNRSIKDIRGLSHGIRKSFEFLTNRDKNTIRKHFAEVAKQRFDCQLSIERGYAIDLDSVLDRAEKLFVDARYRAEGALSTRKRKRAGINHGIRALNRTLHDIILDKRPNWRKNRRIAKHLDNLP